VLVIAGLLRAPSNAAIGDTGRQLFINDLFRGSLGRFLHFAGTQATRAHAHMADTATNDSAHFVQIRQKTPPGRVVSMTHIITAHRSLAANIATFGHGVPPANFQTTF